MQTKIVHSKRVIFLEEQYKKLITLEDIENAMVVYIKKKNDLPPDIIMMYS
jgi:hypothetical protein